MKVRQFGNIILIVMITHELVDEIQAMIYNEPSKLLKFIARDIGVPEFLNKLIV